ncbi:DUF3618 domain-containing protein [Microtetraspora sp. NBRC 16547]|uniref:DUF3618 domain-containing protein n=1 Tax=Microtetraspora sp. NBRC 16547 TaxID=3030993 RepID=UPI0024A2B7CA|nr:DUF3618 domain-containing protein [Microtetraspora sp. NBRC 16547]GLX01292.1 hypothetical protein Misp02_53780 [Microtetraspora sp. NBRC 16547]
MAETDPDALEREIERTRVELARTVDAIADRVSPKRVAERSMAKVKANAERLVGGGLPRREAEYGPEAKTWEEGFPPRDISPVLMIVGAALVVGAAVLLLRRRKQK